jgi:hypothetical protein
MKKILSALTLLALLTACASDEPVPAPKMAYSLPPKIGLDVQSINLVDRSGPQPANSPYATNNFQPTIADAVRQWASDRLQASGPSGQAIVVLKDASLIEAPLVVDHGMDAWLTRQQASKYVAHVEVQIEANGRPGYGLATAQASRFETLPENPTAAERQKAYIDVLNGLMRDLGQNLEGALQQHMHDFIVAPISPDMSPMTPLAPMAPTPAAP